MKKNGPFFLFLLFFSAFLFSCSRIEVPRTGIGNSFAGEIPVDFQPPGSNATRLTSEFSPVTGQRFIFPTAGTKNVFGVEVTEEMELAYRNLLGGEGDKAYHALNQIPLADLDDKAKWQVFFLKAQLLLMMGKAADAEIELDRAEKLEVRFSKGNLNTIALKGEMNVWLGDYKKAKNLFYQVIQSIGSWELPIVYSSFPTNREELYLFSTAKLRSYTGLAAAFYFTGDQKTALKWADEAERLYNNIHYVTNHPFYGAGDGVHADSYYGRAMNLVFRAASRLVVSGDLKTAEGDFRTAHSFFHAFGYKPGEVTLAAIKADALVKSGQIEAAMIAADEAVRLALQAQLYDYVWRVETVKAEILYQSGKYRESEKAYRNAQESVDLISGSLSADRSKLRFGVGKNLITERLIEFDIKRKDYTRILEDLERGRARAFADMLAETGFDAYRENVWFDKIKTLEQKIRKLQLMQLSPMALREKKLRTTSNVKQMILQRESMMKSLRKTAPHLAAVLKVSETRLGEIQNHLKPEDTMALFLPAGGNKSVQMLIIKKTKVSLVDTGRPQKIFDQHLAEIRNAADHSNDNKVTRLLNDLKKMLKLNQWNIKKRLYVIPTGKLHFIPWGGLHMEIPVSILPYAGWFKIASAEKRTGAVVVGNPYFFKEMPQLWGAAKEAKYVAEQLGVNVLTGKKATTESLRQAVGKGIRKLHLATHGVFDSRYPLKSAFFMSGNNQMERVTVAELYNQPIRADFVALSACETGLGTLAAGDDVLGLNRAFFLGGTHSILSSLWTIEDEGTGFFMKRFYSYLGAEKKSYGDAWNLAVRDTQLKGYSPIVYSAFILNGSMD